MDVDPKQFVDQMYRPRATPEQVEAAFEAAGFLNILVDYHPAYRPGGQLYPDGEGYWAVIFFKDNVTADGARQETDAVLASLDLRTEENMPTSVFDWQPDEKMQRSGTLYLPGESLVRGPHNEAAAAVASALLEDEEFTAKLTSTKSEIRILKTSDPKRFDVTLLTGYDPIYVGTIGVRGKNWVPVRVMSGAGRKFKSKLHFVGPTKEATATAMVDALRPLWSRVLNRSRNAALESLDPKQFVKDKVGYESDLKEIIETDFPEVEVLSVKAKPGFTVGYIATIRSKDKAKPLWHSPIYSMILRLEKRLADFYGWKIRPYANQDRFILANRAGVTAGIKPITISYDTATGVPGTVYLNIDFNIMKREVSDGPFNVASDWETPY